MLVRAAGRRQRHRTSQSLAASFAQLHLPWLAPAQLRWNATHSRVASRDPSSRRSSPGRSSQPKAQLRSLATAADQYSPLTDNHLPPPGYGNGFRNRAQDRHIPWETDSHSPSAAPPASPYLRPYHEPIILNTSIVEPEGLIRVQSGLTGSAKELLVHLQTSLSVGRRKRAETIILRLTDQCAPGAPELLYAHTAYLGEGLKDLSACTPGSASAVELMHEMQKWFELEVRRKGVQPDVNMLVIMIRAAIRSLSDTARDVAVRRYAEMSRTLGDDDFFSVIQSDEYDGNEFTVVGRITSDLYDEGAADSEMDSLAREEAEEATEQRPLTNDPAHSETLPEILATKQKGAGLDNIKRTLVGISQLPALPADASLEAHSERAYAKQLRLEELSIDIALERWQKEDEDLKKVGINTAMQSRPFGALMWQWYQDLVPLLKKELVLVKKALTMSGAGELDRKIYGPYLELLPLHRLAATTVLHTITNLGRGKDPNTGKYELEARLNQLTVGLGRAIEDEYRVMHSMRQGPSSRAQYVRKQKIRARRIQNMKTVESPESTRNTIQQAIMHERNWPLAVRVKVGAVLVANLLEAAQLPVTRDHPRTGEPVTQMQPAFVHRTKFNRGRRYGTIVPHPALSAKLQSAPIGAMLAKQMPMIVEPLPWEGWNKGGYLHVPHNIVRLPPGDKAARDYFIAADARNDLDGVYKGLSALGSVPWKIHREVFKVQLEAWNSGEAIANFAPLNPDQDLPPEPADTGDPATRRLWLAEVLDVKHKAAGQHSKRCFQNFQLEVARSLLDETLYFPHNLDFRGRAYPIPPYLNHMGADNVRGLVVFAKGKELGPTGLRWLKIHLATVAGHDKASMEERVQFTETHLEDIYDSVRHPLDGRRWWLQAEDSWQLLAACFELTSALDAPDPLKYISHLPIQQDGTCNGLQHYAALGGDKVGAAQVNLEPGDRPSDVYTAVAEGVKEAVRTDAEAGNPIAQKLHGRITRKCVKQPVMTNVYGVTFYGAKAQVERQLEVLFPEVKRGDDVNLSRMSVYVAEKIFQSLGVMFNGAQAIQDWLGQCALRISTCITPEQIDQLIAGHQAKSTRPAPLPKKRKSTKKAARLAAEAAQKAARLIEEQADVSDAQESTVDASPAPVEAADGTTGTFVEARAGQRERSVKPLFKSSVVWTTPLGLPVVQPYRTTKSKLIGTALQALSIQEPRVWDPVSKRKQLQAFPPNFIHSLDATHMLLSALECTSRGMTFASIHDSFWTHACDVDTLNVVLRDQFVAMHSEDIIGRLREEFQTRYKGCMYLTTVPESSPAGRKIIAFRRGLGSKDTKSLYTSELEMESKRMRLLQSEDAQERAEGEQMVTPSSILLAEGGEATASMMVDEMADQRLGHIPTTPGADVKADVEAGADFEPTNSDADDSLGMDAASEMDVGVDAGLDHAEPMDDDVDAAPAAGTKPSRASKAAWKKPLPVWLPLEFSAVPAKGDFDVTRLRQSKYFFH